MPVVLDRRELERFGVDLLGAAGISAAGALEASRVLMYADERGLDTHGHGALATIYLPRLLDGRIDPAARIRVLAEHRACVAFDAGNGLGLVSMTAAMDRAIDLARRFGVAAATVRRSSHFGAAGYYATRAAQHGCVGIVMTNCGAQRVVPPLGGKDRLFGTNPIGAALPADGQADLVLDMSTTAVAAGRVAAAAREQRAIPAGWLVGENGATVTDASALGRGEADLCWLGGELRSGGAKGFGLGLLVELLCGPLAGAAYGPQGGLDPLAHERDDHDVGHLALVLDPSAFPGGESFGALVAEVLQTLTESATRGDDPVRYPGQPEAERARATAVTGTMTLADHLVGPLREYAERLGVVAPAALRAADRRTS
jgi:LDH2 family malate/lactate/ureidoglycolate dehydrogenase